MFGIDISNHQKGIDLSKRDFDFAIVKATEGKTFIDPSFYSHVEQLNNLGKLIGCYHFARPDNQSTLSSMKNSAKFFVETVEDAGLLYKAILVLDWEQEPTHRIDLMEGWCQYVYDSTGIEPFVYANNSFMKNSVGIENKWLAMWPTINKFEEFASIDWIHSNYPKTPLTIWQYTSNGAWPGFKGRVDYDYTPLFDSTWKKLASGKRLTAEEIANEAQSAIDAGIISNEMKWAIDAGIIKGFSDGTYRPNSTVTRNQLATILYRYNTMLAQEFGSSMLDLSPKEDK